jgi:hypothetical protein
LLTVLGLTVTVELTVVELFASVADSVTVVSVPTSAGTTVRVL